MRHYVILCRVKLVKAGKSQNIILTRLSRISREREGVLDIIRVAWEGQIFSRDRVLPRVGGDPLE